jgi:hypothetical protein
VKRDTWRAYSWAAFLLLSGHAISIKPLQGLTVLDMLLARPCGSRRLFYLSVEVRTSGSDKKSPEARVDEFIFENAPDLLQDEGLHFAYIFEHLFPRTLSADLALYSDVLK